MSRRAMTSIPGPAVVVGGGIAGLLAARVLADFCDRVVVFDRDDLDGGASPRRSIPQGSHTHLLLTAGFRAICELFPGIDVELRATGAHRFEVGRELLYIRRGAIKQSFDGDLETVAVSRPVLEALVRGRVASMPGVALRGRSAITALRLAGDRVQGVELKGGETHPAGLVVDAGGRASRASSWLEGLGWPSPPSTTIELELVYASRFVRLAADPARRWKMLYVGAAAGTWTRGGSIMQVDKRPRHRHPRRLRPRG